MLLPSQSRVHHIIIIQLTHRHSYDLDARHLGLYDDSLNAREPELDFYDSDLEARDLDGYDSDLLYERNFDFAGESELEDLFERSPLPVPEPLSVNLNSFKKSGGG